MKKRIPMRILVFSILVAFLSILFFIINSIKLFTVGLIMNPIAILRYVILLLFFISSLALIKLKKWAYILILALSTYGLLSGILLILLPMFKAFPINNVLFLALIVSPQFKLLNLTMITYLLMIIFLIVPSNKTAFYIKE